MKGDKYGLYCCVLAWLIGTTLCMWPLSCAAETDVETVKTPVRINAIAVMPLQPGRFGPKLGESLDEPISKLSYNAERMKPAGSKAVTKLLQSVVSKRYGEKVVASAVVTEKYDTVPRGEETTLRDLARRLGEAVNASHIIAGNVWKYKERGGTGASSASPAAVAFGIYLIDVNTGKVLWREFFDKEQKSLSENLLDAPDFVKMGGKWLSAEELARFGLKKAFKKCPY